MKRPLFLFLPLLLLAACSPTPPEPTYAPAPTPTPTPVESAAPGPLVWRDQLFEESFADADGAPLMTARYLLPGVSDPQASPARTAIDDYYRAEGERYLETAKETADMAAGDREATASLGYDFTPYAEEAYYALTFQNNDAVSFRRTYYSDLGGPYPATFQFSEVFRLRDGVRLTFQSLFSDPQAARQKIIGGITAQIDQRGDGVFDPAKVDAAFQEDAFYLTADSVVFYFQEGELAPHAAGVPEFPIPTGELEGLMAPW